MSELQTIYGLSRDDGKTMFYVGRTTQDLRTRLAQHKCDAKSGDLTLRSEYIRVTGYDAIQIIPLAVVFNAHIADTVEKALMDEWKTTCNISGRRHRISRRVINEPPKMSMEPVDVIADWQAYRQERRRLISEL